MLLPSDPKKSIIIIEKHLATILPGPTVVMPCPPSIGEVKIPYATKARLLIWTASQTTTFIFLFQGVQSVKHENLPDVACKLDTPSIIIVVKRQSLLLFSQRENLVFDLNLEAPLFKISLLKKWLLGSGNEQKKPQSGIENLRKLQRNPAATRIAKQTHLFDHSWSWGYILNENRSSLERQQLDAALIRKSAEDAGTLADATKALSLRLRDANPEDRLLWLQIAEATIDILPKAILSPVNYAKAIEALARSIVFLSTDNKIKAIRQLIICATNPGISLRDAERTASVVLAILPAVDLSNLALKLSDLAPLAGHQKNIPSNLAQVFSLIFRRG